VPPVPIPLPIPGPQAGPRPTPNRKPERKPERQREPQRRPEPGDDPLPPEPRRRRRKEPLRYVTYRKTNPRTGRVYVGRTAGYGDPRAIVAARDRNHHKTAEGYGPARLDKQAVATRSYWIRWTDPAYQAIRGREQQLIDAYGGARSDNPRTRSGNAIRGVAKENPLGPIYHQAATRAFGQRAPYTGY
jgi:hypothetical protein